MIGNERQYRITKAQAEKFSRALEEAGARKGVEPLLQKVEVDALRSQLRELVQELQEYEALRSGEETVIALESFAELPRALIKARVAAGLTQKELADRLGMKEQQIQRYEATDYRSASVRRLKQVIDALGLRVHADIVVGASR